MMTQSALRAEACAAYERYVLGYSSALLHRVEGGDPIDYGALPFWSFPILLIGGDAANTHVALMDQATFDRNCVAHYIGFYERGWRSVRLEGAEVSLFGHDLAVVDGYGTRLRGDDSVLNQFRAYYWMRRFAGEWRQVALLDTDASIPDIGLWAAWLRGVLSGE